MKWSTRLSYTFLLLTLLLLQINYSFGLLQFRDWGEKCKDTKNGQEIVKPEDECDDSRGLICQKYSQGYYCGCRIGSSLSFDSVSRECRRKVASHCSYETNEEILNRLKFNQKCHERAECVKVNTTGVTGSKNAIQSHFCLCKEGFVNTPEFDQCVSATGQANFLSTSSFSFFLSFFLTLHFFSKILFKSSL